MEDVGNKFCKTYDSSAGGTLEKCKNAYFKATEDGFLYPCEVVGSPDNFECNKAGNDKACNPKAPPPTFLRNSKRCLSGRSPMPLPGTSGASPQPSRMSSWRAGLWSSA